MSLNNDELPLYQSIPWCFSTYLSGNRSCCSQYATCSSPWHSRPHCYLVFITDGMLVNESNLLAHNNRVAVAFSSCSFALASRVSKWSYNQDFRIITINIERMVGWACLNHSDPGLPSSLADTLGQTSFINCYFNLFLTCKLLSCAVVTKYVLSTDKIWQKLAHTPLKP